MKFVIKESQIAGKGCFAREKIQKGETIALLDGEVVSRAECARRIAEGIERPDDNLQIDDDLFIDMYEDSSVYFFNHSCEPNAGVRGKNELFALRDIEKGEEICFDYSTTEAKEIEEEPVWSMQCVCGAKNCRGRIGSIATLSPDLMQKYLQIDAFPDFIKKKFSQ